MPDTKRLTQKRRNKVLRTILASVSSSYQSGLTRMKLKSQTVIRLHSYVNGQKDGWGIREQTPSGNSSPSQVNRLLRRFALQVMSHWTFREIDCYKKVVAFVWTFTFCQKIYPLFESYCSTKGIYRFITLKQRRENLSIFLCALTKYKQSLTWLF